MTVPAKRKTRNIQKSILKFVKANFEIPNSLSGKINYRDETFDPSGLDKWVSIKFLGDGAGKKGATLVQFDLFSRIGGRRSDGDRYGDKLTDLSEKLRQAMHVESIQIYDYSTPSVPVIISNAKIIVKNSDGKFREPEDIEDFDPEDDVLRRAVTYRIITLGDVSRASAYYD